jgi:integrase
VFRGRKGGRLQKSALQRWFNGWLQAADIRDERRNCYTLHSLRRYAAKCWLDGGLNIRQVQLLLGHENMQSTSLYLDYRLDEIERDAAKVDFGLGRLAPRGG